MYSHTMASSLGFQNTEECGRSATSEKPTDHTRGTAGADGSYHRAPNLNLCRSKKTHGVLLPAVRRQQCHQDGKRKTIPNEKRSKAAGQRQPAPRNDEGQDQHHPTNQTA